MRTSPAVSVVVPVRNEVNSLHALVDSLRSQTFSADEIILVDGGSTDETVQLTQHLTRGDERFRVIQAGEATPGHARNVGIAAARNEWIALTDAGIRLEATWLEKLVEVIGQQPSVEVVYGNFEPVTETFFECCAALAYVPPKRLRPGGQMRGPAIPSSLLRRRVWQAVGGFPDLRATEDLIFMERVEAQRFQIGWSPAATIWWHLEPTLGTTFRKFVVYSRNAVCAGRQRHWHYGVARMYLAILPFVVLAWAQSTWWLVMPLLGLLARAAKSIWMHREGRDLHWLLNPAQLVGVSVILLTLDLAMFTGWAQALWRRDGARRHSAPSTGYSGRKG